MRYVLVSIRYIQRHVISSHLQTIVADLRNNRA